MIPVVRVVGLGPGSEDHVTRRSERLLLEASVARLRTRRHPSAAAFANVASYDEWYESAASFEELYAAIVEDLVSLAAGSPDGEVVYAVPGSPVVAERTVELLRAREDVRTITEPAVSVIDVACAALGRDPMAVGLRVVDALAGEGAFTGPGPLLVLQAYSPAVLAHVADRLPGDARVRVLFHLGLADEVVLDLAAPRLASFEGADHLTSLWVEPFRDAGVAVDELVELTRRLRAECPWDQEQTHASLTRHLLEEAYEALDALETFVRREADGSLDALAVDHVVEELGDLLFQIVFHAELGAEEGRFDLAAIADALREKLIGRHPHVFADVTVVDSDDVAARWETLKREEKGRDSVTDGIAWQLPALTLYTKLLRKAALVDAPVESGEDARRRALEAIGALSFVDASALDAASSSDVAPEWGDALGALVSAARHAGVDLEGVLRERARQLRDAIREVEQGDA